MLYLGGKFDILFLIKLAYSVPSLLFMITILLLLITKIYKNDYTFKNEFYPFVVYSLMNNFMFWFTQFIFFGLAGIPDIRIIYITNSNYAKIEYSFSTFQMCNIVLTLFAISFNRFVCVKYPTKYKRYFLYENVVISVLTIFIISFFVGAVSFFYPSTFMYDIPSRTLYSLYKASGLTFYFRMIFIVTSTIIILLSFLFNAFGSFVLVKRKVSNNNVSSKDYWFPLYSIFVFVTSTLLESCYILRFISNTFNSPLFCVIAMKLIYYLGDLCIFGDFYFLVFFSADIKREVRSFSKKMMIKKKQTVIIQPSRIMN
uniref:Serpentine receptor class gamma n=1 Tax=Parastrongyloides trichosuri TaxID=131310 RepID=A0A0N4ZLM4_PARTI